MRIGDIELELGELIDSGGMAEVFAAVSSQGHALAVKRLRPALALQPEFVAMFHDEARISAELVHPNIVRTLGSGTQSTDGRELPVLLMEQLQGPSVRELIHRARDGAPADPAASLTIGWQVASALAYAHGLSTADGQSRELVHRDVSPSNIIVDRSGSAKLIDFGIAKAIERLAERTRTGILKGKDGYMSPEQCLGGRVDQRSDIFSLGVVLYELLTCRALFRRDPIENSFTVMERVTSGRVPQAPLETTGLSQDATNIVLRCLEHEPEERFSGAAELAVALAAAVQASVGEPPSQRSTLLEALAS